MTAQEELSASIIQPSKSFESCARDYIYQISSIFRHRIITSDVEVRTAADNNLEAIKLQSEFGSRSMHTNLFSSVFGRNIDFRRLLISQLSTQRDACQELDFI